jgi:hypothetical protein
MATIYGQYIICHPQLIAQDKAMPTETFKVDNAQLSPGGDNVPTSEGVTITNV